MFLRYDLCDLSGIAYVKYGYEKGSLSTLIHYLLILMNYFKHTKIDKEPISIRDFICILIYFYINQVLYH